MKTNNSVILKQWIKADVNNDGHLDFGEIKNLCHTLNMEIDDRTLKQKFAEFDADRRYVPTLLLTSLVVRLNLTSL